jgi:hypothetical protein
MLTMHGMERGDAFKEHAVWTTQKIAAGVLALGLGGGLLFAVGTIATEDLPRQQTFAGVSYITGGIGQEEAAAMKAAEKDYTLSLLFAQTKRGEYLADINVRIVDHAGYTTLEAVSNGPMLLANLPVGTYRISAEHEGTILTKTVHVDARQPARAAFVWQPAAKATIE